MSASIEVTADLLAGFLDEAPAYLTALEEGLLAFEAQSGDGVVSLRSEADEQRMNEMFRAAHSLKGIAASMGFDRIRDLTHHMESLFDQFRCKKRDLLAEDVQTLFSVVDRLRALIDELASPGPEQVAVADAIAVLERLLSTKPDERPAAATAPADPNPAAAATSPAEPAAPKSSEEFDIRTEADLMQRFVESTDESLDALSAGLLALESAPGSMDIINDVFRCAHNIKGASGAVRCHNLHALTHDMESVLDRVRRGELPLDTSIMNAVFAGVDRLRSDLESVRKGLFDALSPDGLDDIFSAWVPKSAPPLIAEAPPAPATPTAPPSTGLADAMTVRVTFPESCGEAPILACIMHNRLSDIGEVRGADPDVYSLNAESALPEVTYYLETELDVAAIERILRAYPIADVRITPPASLEDASNNVVAPASPIANPKPAATISPSTQPTSPAPAPAARATDARPPAAAARSSPESAPKASPARSESQDAPGRGAAGPKPGETIRVDLERLDQLMNLGGELVITKARFVEISKKLASIFSRANLGFLVDDMAERLTKLRSDLGALATGPERRASIAELSEEALHLSSDFEAVRSVVKRVHETRTTMGAFTESVQSLTRIADGMQRRIMQTRMVAIGPLFQRFRRVVRDLCKSTNKEVDLVLHGEATELDKRMIDELVDPLTHMIRNSVDHGIESPDERQANGKPRTGQVVLNAFHRGRHIFIEVRDDGRGLDVAAIRAKLIDRELVTAAQLEQMSDTEAMQYVFRPGFSTAKQVTELSGRGMGMDIVKTKLEGINGSVTLDSQPGVGTAFTIHLPLTLAIISGMMVRIGGGVYALPLETVIEIITVPRSDLLHIQKRAVIRVRDRVIPVACLEEILNVSHPGQSTRSRDEDQLTVMILGMQEDRLGLVVDELIGQEDIVIKDIAANYENVDGIAGASIMGDGTVSLILDVASLMSSFGRRATRDVSVVTALSEARPKPVPT